MIIKSGYWNYYMSFRIKDNKKLFRDIIEKKYNDYNVLVNKLEILNPLNTLKRGYSITKKDNKVLTSIKNIKKDEMIEVNLSDGIINAKVNEIKEN